jgi:hypothetical protein
MAHTQPSQHPQSTTGNNNNTPGNNTKTTDASSSSGFAGISMTTIIHIATEILIIGGVTYWLNSKIKTQEDNNKLLLERLTKCEEQITKQNEIIAHHENALRQFHALIQGLPAPKGNNNQNTQKNQSNTQQRGGGQQPQNQQQQPQNRQKPNRPNNSKQTPPSQKSPSNNTQNTSPIGSGPNNPNNSNGSSNPRKNVGKTINNGYSQIEEVEDETEVQSGGEESGDIDDLLQDEINDLDGETGVECNDDECVVPSGNSGSKKKMNR